MFYQSTTSHGKVARTLYLEGKCHTSFEIDAYTYIHSFYNDFSVSIDVRYGAMFQTVVGPISKNGFIDLHV